MNLLDAYVEEVLSEPYKKYNKLAVKVSYTCWSTQVCYTELFFSTLEEALAVKPGYEFWT